MMMLSQAAAMMHGELSGDDVVFHAVSKDTRTIAPGDLYVVISGENFDGHDFVGQAHDAGAVGAVVSRRQDVNLAQIHVEDTRLALGELAAGWRQKFHGGMIGITGSSGKTTVKEMCRCILERYTSNDSVLSTLGNLNNDIGMPMTLLLLNDAHRYAVIEMGANHVGEINYLSNIAKPDVAVVTNAGAAHLEGFGSIEKVAQAKAEIYGSLGDGGTAVINLDDAFSDYWRDLCREKQIMTFSMQHAVADVYAQETKQGWFLRTPMGDVSLALSLPGRHNIMNALAATAATLSLGVPVDCISEALADVEAVPGRMMIRQAANDACIIDDTYNANPSSLKAAVDVLVTMQGEAWLVLGDMAELGGESNALHFEMGREARQAGVTRLFATGQHSAYAVEAFGKGAKFFAERSALIDALKKESDANKVILVKGSRFMAMEEVVKALLENTQKREREIN